jgi:archaellum component FlaC
MERYDVILVIFSLAAFVLSVGKVTAGFTKAIGRLESTVEQLGAALSELKQTLVTIRDENKRAHGEMYGRMEDMDRRIVRLETKRSD